MVREEARDLTRREFGWRLGAGLGLAVLAAGCGDGGEGPGDVGGADRPDGGDGGPLDDGAPGETGAEAGPDGGPLDDGAPGDVVPGDVVPDATGTCTVYPKQTAGPYYLDLDLLRRDVTEGKAGAALAVVFRVLAADGCTPLRDKAVDIWHCDADGIYSGFAGQLGGLDTTGQRFLRGTQVTDADGLARFDSIVPGWYPGRTPHIHFKVHLSATTEATSQLYFDESFTAEVYDRAPYADRGPQDTTNARDGIFAAGGPPPLAVITRPRDGSAVATLLVVVAGTGA